MDIDAAEALVEKTAQQLGQKFEAVLILVSQPPGDGSGDTEYIYRGTGNVFARVGMAHDFLNTIRDDALAGKLAEIIENPGDGDAWKQDK